MNVRLKYMLNAIIVLLLLLFYFIFYYLKSWQHTKENHKYIQNI